VPEHLACKYLLLTEFKVCTVSYGLSFFALIYGPSVKRAGHKSKGKKQVSVTYSMDRENETSKNICHISTVRRPDGLRNDFFSC